MTRIPPVPTSRIPGLLARQRLTQQYQTDQLDLFRLQEQISTGLRITLPSDDAPAALRAISFQRLLDRKEQIGSNINSGLLFLGSTDATLGGADGVASVLSQIKADTLGVVGTVSSQEERDAAIANINGALEALVTLGNRQFNGRYIFAGSQSTTRPYSFDGDNVVYHGDARQLRNHSDIGVLYSSSISGQDVFGGTSAAVEGTVDLNPQARAETLLSSLRSGRGVNANGSIQVADASTNELSIVDLSSATTLGDVARLIEDNPPSGSTVRVDITAEGLRISIPGGDLSISEVGTGTTARELGLLDDQTPGDVETVTSEDLNPQLLKTTRLDDLLGSKATVRLESGGNNNDIFLEAKQNGPAANGVSIEVIDGGDIGATANVVFNGGTNTLEIYVDDSGETTANHIVDAINADASLSFTASLDAGDSSTPPDAGTGEVSVGLFPDQTSGGSGTSLDQDSGIRLVNGGEAYDVRFDEDETVEDLLNRLNRADAGIEAKINDAGTGLIIRSRLSGNDFQIGELDGGTTATQLGIRTYGTDSKLSDFNFGVGVPTKDATETTLNVVDLTITPSTGDADAFDVDLTTATNVADAINLINTDVDNDDGSGGLLVTAQLNADGNGIELVDNTAGTERLTVRQTGDPVSVTGGIDLTIPSVDFNVTAADGTTLAINLSGAETVGDVLDTINNHPDNDDGGGGLLVRAQLAETGNGIELVDLTGGGGSLTVTKIGTSQAAEFLGLLGKDQTSNSTNTGTLTGVDRNSVENDSVFNSLIRLRDALAEYDVPAIERAAAKLDDDIERVTFAQADVGTRFKNLELAKFNLQDEEIQIRSALSEEIDVDLVQAISDLTARQISLEASLRATANILQLSLLNFI